MNHRSNVAARIRLAIKQNKAVVSMIETSRYSQAIGILKALLPHFRDDLRAQALHVDPQSEPRSVLIQQLLRQSASTMLNRRGDTCDEHEGGFLYDQPVEIPRKLELETLTIASEVVSSILLFNLALALQLKAIASAKATDRSTADRCFVNSLQLYRVVMAMNGTSRLLSMIILNNVAQIHKGCNSHEKAKECFQHLLAIWITCEGACPGDLEGMVYNAMGWYDTSKLPAAAA